MNILRRKFTCLFTILTFTLNIRMYVQITHEKLPETVSGDFESFLNSLRSMVFKKATRVGSDGLRRRDDYSFTPSSPPPTQISMRNESLLKLQKATLRDMLMMKLVSYYENKYKITDSASTTPDIYVQSEHYKVNDVNALQNSLKSVIGVPNEEVVVI